jgi:anti-sigma regulatory factor (Ser/Thr protein kinase)
MDAATVERARSERIRSLELREQSELLSQRIVDNVCRFDAAVGDSDTFFMRLARVRPAVGLGRRRLSRWLELRGVPGDDVGAIALACSEACANAVEHPVEAWRQSFTIGATHRDGAVEVLVRSSGRWRVEQSAETRGRGLKLIEALMTEVEVVRGDRDTLLRMRRELHG